MPGPQQTIGSRHPAEQVVKIEHDAERCGLDLSEWMRMAADLALAAKVKPGDAQAYRKPRRNRATTNGARPLERAQVDPRPKKAGKP